MPITVGDQVGRISAPPGLDHDAPERRGRGSGGAFVLPAVDPRRNRIVYAGGNFPSVRYLYQAQPGPRVVICEATTGSSMRSTSGRCSCRSATCSSRAPRSRTSADRETAHEVGGARDPRLLPVRGIVPLDVTALGVDFAVGGSVKWLCGGPGNGWLYVRPDLAERLEPTFTGWQAHERPFDFEEEMRYATGAHGS